MTFDRLKHGDKVLHTSGEWGWIVGRMPHVSRARMGVEWFPDEKAPSDLGDCYKIQFDYDDQQSVATIPQDEIVEIAKWTWVKIILRRIFHRQGKRLIPENWDELGMTEQDNEWV